MTIDERLERLTERHEALAQSIELLTHDISELRAATTAAAELAAAAITAATTALTAAATAATAASTAATATTDLATAAAAANATGRERHEALSHSVELLVAEGQQTGEKIRHLAIIAEENEVRAGQMMENMSRLGHILEIHDRHIDQHAHRIERLEG
jgi:chromosome segregation ATPase